MGSEQIPKLVGQLVRSPQEASNARDALGLKIGNDVLAPDGDGSQLRNLPSGDKTFTYTQMVATNIWNITHNLDKYPAITIIDSAENTVFGEIFYLDSNRVTLAFTASFTGIAYFN